MRASNVVLEGLSFAWPNGSSLFTNINLSFESKIYGLVGPNGIGKTSLVRLIAGELSPTAGRIQREASLGYLPQKERPPAIEVAQYLGENAFEWNILAYRLMEDLPYEQLCSKLSGGQWMRLRIAKSLLEGRDFLILDEPTNDLDREGRFVVYDFVESFTGGLILISHDRELLSRVEEVIEISNQGIDRFGGPWSEYEVHRDLERKRLAQELTQSKKTLEKAKKQRKELLQRQMKRQRQGLKEGLSGSMPKIIAGGKKRQAEKTLAKVNTKTLKQEEFAVRDAWDSYSQLKVDPIMYADLPEVHIPSSKLIAEAMDFNIRYLNSPEWLFKNDLSFVFRGPVRVAIHGTNGSGKSTLVHQLSGLSINTEARGHISRGNLNWALVDQKCSDLDDEKCVFDNLRESSLMDETQIREGLAKFLFQGDRVFQYTGSLSGGERLRAALAKAFLCDPLPEVLILDEPTNNLDLINIEFLENFLKAYTGALIVISHDLNFIKNIAIDQELCL